MSSFLEKIKMGKDAKRTVLWPGTDVQVEMRILSRDEIQSAQFAAQELFRKNGIELGFSILDEYQDEVTTQQLYRSLSNPENGTPLASTISQFRQNVTREEISELASAYSEMEEEYSPNHDKMSEDQFKAFYEKLKKKPQEMLSNVSSIAFAKRLVITLVENPQN